MPAPLAELENVLVQLIDQQRKLLAELERYQAAMRTMNVQAMEASRSAQEVIRQRIAQIDQRRRVLAGTTTLTKLAEMHPQSRVRLLALRDELRNVIAQITQRTHVAGKVAGAVLGHLNTVMRLLSGAMQQAGVYTRHGVPKLAPRIGAMDAVA